MKYLTCSLIATKWNISKRSVRNYCNHGRVVGAVLQGKTWLIPENASKHNIVPMIINEELKLFYYRGLKEYKTEKEYLIDTCLYGQDIVKKYFDYFKIPYNN